MITRTFLNKSTTIIRESTNNYGLHPICMLNYGNLLSRFIISFDIKNIIEKIEDKTYTDTNKLRHILKMKNCGSINSQNTKEMLPSSDINGIKERATSFTLIAFKVPQEFDEGVGFDNESDFWITGKSAESTDGCTWYKSNNETLWPEDGIYSTETLEAEYNLYKEGKESIIIAEQHFDHGNEDLCLDLTNYVNSVIRSSGETNNDICIAFSPDLEQTETKITQYVGFFNNHTNTIYNPIIESRYDCNICDDRMTFALNKENKLYLYSFIDGKLENLDELPTCSIENYSGNTVIQESKGIYSTTIKLSSREYSKNMIIYDTWGNIKHKGEELDDVELEFVTHPSSTYFSIGNDIIEPKILNPFIVGINDNEKINRGEVRIMKVFYKIPYTHSEYKMVNESWYRIYVKDGDREVDIVDWDKMLKTNTHSLFLIYTDEYIPTEYHIDIKAKFGDEIRIFKNELTFKIISNISQQKI